jgi:hypothetical protein
MSAGRSPRDEDVPERDVTGPLEADLPDTAPPSAFGKILDLLTGGLAGLVIARTLKVWFWVPGGSEMVRGLGMFLMAAGFLAAAIRVYVFLRNHLVGLEPRLVALAIVAAVFGGAVVQPELASRGVTQQQLGTNRQLQAQIVAARAELLRRWRADITESGSHGPNGAEPPMMHIQDLGRRVEVRSLWSFNFCIRMTRSDGESHDPACRLHVPGGGEACEILTINETKAFVLASTAPEHCATLPIEFEVGTPELPDPTWWSDGALRTWDEAHRGVQ